MLDGTCTLTTARLPCGSLIGFPWLSVKFGSNAPFRPPVVSTLYHPVADMSTFATPNGNSIPSTHNLWTPWIGPDPTSTSQIR